MKLHRKLVSLSMALCFMAGSMVVHADNTLSNSSMLAPEVTSQDSFGMPSGMVAFFNLATCPSGWAMSNGQNGTVDLRGEFVRGWDAGRGVDSGRVRGSAQLDQMQRITGRTMSAINPRRAGNVNGVNYLIGAYGSGIGSKKTAPHYDYVVGFDSGRSPGARVSANANGETRSRNVALLACEKK